MSVKIRGYSPERKVTIMLSITAKVKILANELDSAINLCSNIIGALSNCREQNLTEHVGVFARQMPDYKILTQEKREAMDLIREVCTAEVTPEEARRTFLRARKELENTRKLINL